MHIHLLPSFFFALVSQLFADDLVIQISGDLEKRVSRNILVLEERAKIVLESLKKFADDKMLPVNVNKTKEMLVHSVVSPSRPKIEFNNQPVQFVKSFKYLEVTITVKLWLEQIHQ